MALLAADVSSMVRIAADGGGRVDATQTAAESWRTLVDEGDCAASWEKAAEVCKGSVKQAGWERMVAGVRTSLGKLGSRKLKSRNHGATMPGAPDGGEYGIAPYDTVFEKKAAAVREAFEEETT